MSERKQVVLKMYSDCVVSVVGVTAEETDSVVTIYSNIITMPGQQLRSWAGMNTQFYLSWVIADQRYCLRGEGVLRSLCDLSDNRSSTGNGTEHADIPANTRRSLVVGLMSAHRRRRGAGIKPTMSQAAIWLGQRQKQKRAPVLQCRNVAKAGTPVKAECPNSVAGRGR